MGPWSLFHVQEGNSDVTRSLNSATRKYRQVNATQGKRRNNLHFGTSYHSEKETNYAGKFPEEFHAAEYGCCRSKHCWEVRQS